MQVMERLNEILEVATRSYDLIASPQRRHKGGSQTPSVNTADITNASGMRLSRPADPSADAVPERQSSPGQNDLPQHEMEATSEPVGEPEEEPEDAVESIPAEHDTAAHKLILLWPTIAEFTKNVAPSPNYPLEAEEKRGLLRLYGRGEGTGEQDEETQGDSSSPASIGSPTEDSSSVPSPSEAVWGYTYKLDVPPSIVVRRPELYSAGGLNQDQSLKLEAPIVRYLVDSYYRNMHILHPFIDKKTMDRRIELFIKRHNPNATASRSPFALAGVQSGAEPHRSRQRLKRKYSDETMATFGRPGGPEATKPPSRPTERSINSAIILLMLAIGKWEDEDPPAREINAARMRAKYYGARYIINRTFLDYALHVMDPQRKNKPLLNAQGQRRTGVEPLFKVIGQLPEQSIKDAAKICVESAMSSTVAFDNIASFPNRLIITNIFGTAHAQFGNMLVLAATYRSFLHHLVSKEKLERLLERTIMFCRRLTPISAALRIDVSILEQTAKIITGNIFNDEFDPRSTATSFNAHP
ncbi:hypothetical protein B0A49_08609 [Cryomyces minteri]|uniref:Transcription factor domain-containing protein n=1 Tax=Cryomyces minteri TaxID=331657 RepID=A0A4U0X0T0_9PEZI|nr:hypothetical protein B0A49_08609 [Cryomyces minteri]